MKTRRQITRGTRMRIARDALLVPLFLFALAARAFWRWA